MTPRMTLEGIIPAAAVVFTDPGCETLDYDACRDHYRWLLSHDISALCIGGHAGEVEALTMEERLNLLRIAREEAGGRVPVMGGVVADSTWSAIEQVKIQKDHGADMVLICPPNIVGWDAAGADAMLIAHFKAINDKGALPFVIYGGPGDNSSVRQLPPTFTRIATECDQLVAWKIAVRGIAEGGRGRHRPPGQRPGRRGRESARRAGGGRGRDGQRLRELQGRSEHRALPGLQARRP